MDESRRAFLRHSMAAVAAGVAASVAPGLAMAEGDIDTSKISAPEVPFAYHELDPEKAKERAYKGFYNLGGCAATVFDSIIGELADQYGYPYNQVPCAMYRDGHSGYCAGSLCGSLGGAAGAIGLLIPKEDVDTVLKELEAWYAAAEFPIYQPEYELVTTVANSVNCADSLGTWKKASGITENSDPLRKARCAGLSGDVAAKTVELMNIYYGYAEKPAEETVECGENQYIATGKGFGGDVTVRVTMDGDKIANVEVLSHSETAGIGTNAIDQLPEKFIGLTAADIDGVDSVSGATVTSGALKEAVKAAVAMAK